MITFAAIVDGVLLKKDSTLSIRLGTQELSAEDTAEIFKLGNKQIYVGFAETAITNLEVPKDVVEFDGGKSTSERLHNVLFVYWNTKTDKTKDFETFRRGYMEKVIQTIKDKLD